MAATTDARAIVLVRKGAEAAALAGLSDAQRAFVKATGFEATAGRGLVLAGPDGAIDKVVFGMGDSGDGAAAPLELGGLVTTLPAGNYRIEPSASGVPIGGQGARSLARPACPRLSARWLSVRPIPGGKIRRGGKGRPAGAAGRQSTVAGRGGSDLPWPRPDQHARCRHGAGGNRGGGREIAGRHGDEVRRSIGDELLTEKFPMIHAVGRASPRPRGSSISPGASGGTHGSR